MNKVWENMLRRSVDPRQNNWDELPYCAEFAVNNAKQVLKTPLPQLLQAPDAA